MEKMKNDIGELFGNAFEKHKVSPEKEEWDMLSTTLQKRNFFRFNATQFNVYYASSIIFCFLVCIGVGSHYAYNNVLKQEKESETISSAPVSVSSSQNTSILNDQETVERNVQIFDSKVKIENKNIDKSLDKLEKEVVRGQLVNQKMKDSKGNDTLQLKSNVNTHSASVIDSIIEKPKRVLYITKQDTIVKFDTLKLSRQKKKWFK